ncbi:hypothetical protein [Salegentibacter salarius]|uniref:Uncharacterized protein n=1 Tax=Salegentibacter salarius TaxID=435906 RepID=A0A2N0TRQ4_9FLAO|nr:hypothetical protein [Salegentibacter salarius]OEY71826.1 hypothetical protein BHS39_03950 [Salegentibacter salarius]PKD17419.1 hypothetical protein APR40_03950 [Salegentibacter salarius]SLJ89031.1 hypothetical protein SAMN05660445_00737 [Salegentibacter salarius]
MNSFETRIVKTLEPSVFLRIVFIILLLGGGALTSVFEVEAKWLRVTGSIAFILGMFGALSQSFVKPKYLGDMEIDETRVKIDLANSKEKFLISELKEIGFKYAGYASFWKYTLHGNKNHIYFTRLSGERYNYEIILQNKQMEEELKIFLEELSTGDSISFKKFGNPSF